jgi:hypothetical protein
MNSNEIESNVKCIFENFLKEELPFDLLRAYGISKTSITRQLNDPRRELNPNVLSTINNERGDEKDNDAYFSIQIKIGYTLRQKRKTY